MRSTKRDPIARAMGSDPPSATLQQHHCLAQVPHSTQKGPPCSSSLQVPPSLPESVGAAPLCLHPQPLLVPLPKPPSCRCPLSHCHPTHQPHVRALELPPQPGPPQLTDTSPRMV